MLAYVNTYSKRSSAMQMKIALLSFFNEYEIAEAKDKLLENLKDHTIDITQESTMRNNSMLRSAKEATVDDLLSIFQKLDQSLEDRPMFLVEDISMILPASPEAGGSVMSLVESMAKLQRELQEVRQTTVNIRQDMQLHASTLEDHDERIKAVTTSTSRPNTEVKGKQSSMTLTQGQPTASSSAPVDTKMLSDALKKVTENRPTMAEMVQLACTDEEGFTLVRGKKAKMAAEKAPAKQRGTQGTAEGAGNLKAGPHSFKVRLTNINPSINENDIRDYVKSKDDSLNPTEITDMTSDGWNTKRYILTFDSSAYDKIMNASFWSPKIYFKQWFDAKGKAK